MHDDSLDDALDAARQPRSGARVFNLFSKRAFDYSFLGISTTSITLHRALSDPSYYYWLGLRIHNRDNVDGTFTLQLFQTLPSGQDPQEFSAASPSLSLECIAAGTPPDPRSHHTAGARPILQGRTRGRPGDRGGAVLRGTLRGAVREAGVSAVVGGT